MSAKMSSRAKATIQDEQRISTWAIAENADNVLHSRIQSYLIAQTFLVTAYATLLTVTYSREVVFLARVTAILVTVLGFVISHEMQKKMRSILARLDFLMEHELVRDPGYERYITAGGKFDVKSATKNEFVDQIPILVQVFWSVTFALTLFFFAMELAK
jgi:hypothetical protein